MMRRPMPGASAPTAGPATRPMPLIASGGVAPPFIPITTSAKSAYSAIATACPKNTARGNNRSCPPSTARISGIADTPPTANKITPSGSMVFSGCSSRTRSNAKCGSANTNMIAMSTKIIGNRTACAFVTNPKPPKTRSAATVANANDRPVALPTLSSVAKNPPPKMT